MPKYYLLAEAFNLNHMVYDTHDISTIRGGSFLLLNAIKRLQKNFENRLKPISTAASTGLFVYEDAGNLDAQRAGIAQEVLRVLHDDTGGYATFLVAIEKDIPENFQLVLARLEAEVRRQQWRMPTVVVPDFDATDQECYLDGWRPGVEPYTLDPMFKISKATYYRRERGRELKHTLFQELFGEESDGADLCAKDLGELANDSSKGILNGKIAFIHIDGNSFGSIREKKCIDPITRENFDATIQKYREDFLDDLRKAAYKDPDFHFQLKNGIDVLRLEVLLWGGDECTIVVPAWKGLEVLERFYRKTADLKFGGVQMTHRAVVIFCHHDAPILQVRMLAERMLEIAKKNIKNQFEAAFGSDPALSSLADEDRTQQQKLLSNAKYCNAARYLVLESFDMLRGSLEQFLERYYGDTSMGNILLHASIMSEIRVNMRTICERVPKSRVINLASAISRNDIASKEELRNKLNESIEPEQRDVALAAIDAFTKENNAGWFILADLWDYAQEWKA
ncbi:MAG: hypothetical protein PHQ34_03645 [Methanothrix sp.]|nr:hypothetical protein [Methanothrix sp.]